MRLLKLPVYLIAILFWSWSCLSTFLNSISLTVSLERIILQSYWFVVFFFFSVYFISNNKENEKFAGRVGVFFLICSGIYYIVWIFLVGDIYVSGTVNAVYYFVTLLPLVFVCRRNVTKVFIVAIVVIGIFCSGKRTGFLAIIFAILIPVLLRERGFKHRFIKTLLMVIGTISFLYVIYVCIDNWFDITLFERLSNIEKDDGSGRIFIYKEVLRAFSNNSIKEIFIGKGYNAVFNDHIVLLISKWEFGTEYTSAHNDFLEVVYDYGFIGLVLYVVFLFQILRCGIRLLVQGNRFCRAHVSAFIIFIIMSMTSHLILYPTYIVFLLMIFSLGIKESLRPCDDVILRRCD